MNNMELIATSELERLKKRIKSLEKELLKMEVEKIEKVHIALKGFRDLEDHYRRGGSFMSSSQYSNLISNIAEAAKDLFKSKKKLSEIE